MALLENDYQSSTIVSVPELVAAYDAHHPDLAALVAGVADTAAAAVPSTPASAAAAPPGGAS